MKALLLVCALFMGGIALAQQTPSLHLTVTGQNTWTVGFGLGSASLLEREDLSPGQPTLTQNLRAEIAGQALGFLTLNASFNDQLGPGFQEFLLIADREPWTGELGRFVVGAEGEGLGVYNKRVLGARGTYTGGGITMTALATRVEGVPESRTFRGERGQREVTFTVADPDDPWRPAPYLGSVEGLAFWPLRAPFVEGLSRVALRVDGTPELWALLAHWGLAYLQEDLAAELRTPLPTGQYVVFRDNGDVLALRGVPPVVLTRTRILAAIDAHNTRLGLRGDARRTYPFVAGSELETRFLTAFSAFLDLLVNEDRYPLPEARFRRYLPLGERDVIQDTVEVWIRLPGERDFRPSTDPALAAYAWTVLPAEGVLRIAFPDAFFTDGAVRASFAFRREGAQFALGLSLVPGSERVYLNGRLLARGTDYSIDYEVGFLLLFTPLGPEDELRVDFERQRGGLGVAVDYERNLFGLAMTVPGWGSFRLGAFRAMDFGAPRPETRTMPNTHTVATVASAGEVAGWRYSLNLSASENVFPLDDNARIASPNTVTAIASAMAPDGEHIVFGHHNGITVGRDGTFAEYGAARGLTGGPVRALLALPGQLLVGTDGGLTVVRLAEPAPFDRAGSWIRVTRRTLRGREEPVGPVLALAAGGGRVFLATDTGVASFAPDQAEKADRWEELTLPADETEPTSLLWAHNRLYLGTTDGLYARTETGWAPVAGVAGPVHALVARGEDVYVASDQGIRIVRNGAGAGWVVVGRAVRRLALHEGALWYAAEDGLWAEDEAAPAVTGSVTAVGAGQGAVWAASAAGNDFRLDLWRVADRVERLPQSRTKLDGRDLARFRDIPAAKHTWYGLSGVLSLVQTFGDWRWNVRLASRLPGYEEIGRPGRSDAHGIGVSARYEGTGPTTWEFRAGWDGANLATEPRGRLRGSLDWRWSDGPTASLSLTPTLTGDGAVSLDRLEMGWNAGLSNQTRLWSWGLTTGGSLRHPTFSAAGQVGATVSLRPAQGWDLDLGWTLPFRTAAALGEQTFRAVAKWALELDRVFLDAAWRETLQHHLTTGAWRGERAIEAGARPEPWAVGQGALAPRLAATFTETAAERRWTGRAETSFSLAPVTLRLGVTYGHGFRPAIERAEQTLAVSLGWENADLGGARASLQWDKSWTVLSHPGYPARVTETERAALRLTWDPTGARWRNALTLSWKPADREVTLTNRISWPLEYGTFTADTTAELNGAELDLKTSAGLGLPLDAVLRAVGARPVGDAWGLNAELGHILGVKPGGEPSHALFLNVTLSVRF